MDELMGQIAMVAMLPLFVFLVLLRPILAKRRRMFARAKGILEAMDDPEERVELLLFRFGWYGGKGREEQSRIREIEQQGWTFVKGTAAPFHRTICLWGGGVNLHFAREHHPDERPELTSSRS